MLSFSSIKTGRVDMTGAAVGDTAERRAHVSFLDYIYEGQAFYTLSTNAKNSLQATLCAVRQLRSPAVALFQIFWSKPGVKRIVCKLVSQRL
ncbi:transporter substrate-binding domain-containing protein [Bradyrhizobium brasilense]|nr:transporter substrate-binding domain-containing protein [Bradyrhizobium brasilense]